jgi:hypothetical protein
VEEIDDLGALDGKPPGFPKPLPRSAYGDDYCVMGGTGIEPVSLRLLRSGGNTRLPTRGEDARPCDPFASWRIDGSGYAMSDEFVAALPSED